MREYEVAAEVEYAMRMLGSEDEGHRTVVTSGPRTALGVGSGFTTDREMREGELVIVDTGATVNRYRTDLGRPYVLGKPTGRQKEIYNLVREAWHAAFTCVRPGAIAGDVDAAARRVFGEYEKYFDHEIGHGMGLTFEPPALGKNSKDMLKENMVVTVEPGLYIDGFGGILVEDTTVVIKDGAQRLSAPPLDWD
jgi:Xaa-Pro aminopeptidase